jgi:zinc/manganese transport system substrate-binding protein
VVVAENFWGSIVRQLAGSRMAVSAVITNPAADPHDYEPRPSDARAIASADLVVVNGIGYDAWAQKLLDANPRKGRVVLDVGKVLGLQPGANPHQWYSPSSVSRVVDAVTADLQRLDAGHASHYGERRQTFLTQRLAQYTGLIASIREHYAGTPVGATESIFSPLADALGLHLLTPESFLDAIAEGAEPTSRDKITVDQQSQTRAIKVLVYNRQNATPDVQRLISEARSARIPITTITETLTPATATFQAWQVKQLRALQAALAKAS